MFLLFVFVWLFDGVDYCVVFVEVVFFDLVEGDVYVVWVGEVVGCLYEGVVVEYVEDVGDWD